MLSPGQAAGLDRERVLELLREVQLLQNEHGEVIVQLRAMLDRLEHPSNRPLPAKETNCW
jgi:hypothetical protein